MKQLAPVFLAGGAAIIVITTAVAGAHGAFMGKVPLTPYLYAYGVALLAFVVAGVLFYRQDQESKRYKPSIAPIRFGYLSNAPQDIDGRWYKSTGHAFSAEDVLAGKQYVDQGLVFRNDGETAYHISIPKVSKVGPSKLVFPGRLTRLEKSQGEAVLTAVIECTPHTSIISGLFDQMKRNNVDRVSLTMEYRGDSHTAWWATVCDIERNANVKGGLEITRFRQKRITKAWWSR